MLTKLHFIVLWGNGCVDFVSFFVIINRNYRTIRKVAFNQNLGQGILKIFLNGSFERTSAILDVIPS